jgi:hypothetical protein
MIEVMLFFLLLAIKGCKRDRKGWMKIFEASIAITLVMGFMVLVYSQTIEKAPPGENLMVWENGVLDNLKKRPELRQEILDHPETVCDPEQGGLVYSFIFVRITKMFPGFGFSCRVCDPGEICGIQSYHKEVYSEERIIAATLTTFSPKKIKLFAWPLEPGEELKPIACTTNWQCPLDWEVVDCIGGKKTQICTDMADCAKTKTRTEEQYCVVDNTPPGSVMSLVCSGSSSFVSSETITCTWTSPSDRDFKESLVYVNDVLTATIARGQESKYQKTGITTNVPAAYNIKILTKDNLGNINNTEIGNKKSCSIVKTASGVKAVCIN